MPLRLLRPAAVLALLGCQGGADDTDLADPPTWHQDIHPLIAGHCGSCHTDGAIADRRPFDTYEQVHPYAALIAKHTGERTMPPFIADDTDDCSARFPLLHDTRLNPAEIALFEDWWAAGAPLGDAGDAAPLPEPPSLGLAQVDLELAPEHGYTMAKGDRSICWSLAPNVPPGTWLDAVEVVPGDDRVTHHIQIQVHAGSQIDGKMGPEGYWECTGVGGLGGTDFAGWLPGTRPVEMPDGVGVELHPNSRITMQIHYHNVYDEPIYDQTRLRLRFKQGPPGAYVEPKIFRVGNFTTAAQGLQPGPNDRSGPEFRIPAGASGHTEEMLFTVPGTPGNEWYAFMLTNHMHQVGVDMRMWVRHDPATKHPDEPYEECLLATPRYDFGWQAFFYYDARRGQAPVMRQGDTIRIQCTFDNTTDNKPWMDALRQEGLPPVPIDVVMGESSLDEMCLAMVGVLEKRALDALP